MSDINTIKDRVRKLMAVAGDGVASEHEIDTAMRLAAKLCDAHHLNLDEVKTPEQEADDLKMGRFAGLTSGSKLSTWESCLAWAVVYLLGCVKHYASHQTAPIRTNGIAQSDGKGGVKQGRKMFFYGPETEAREAAELFQEWSQSIATMGVIRWGGCFRGDGAMYCMGFATALMKKTQQINHERELVAARPLAQLQGGSTTAITLSGRYEILKKQATEYLEKECGVKLSSRGGGGGGYSAGSSGAYSEGVSHGQSAGFGRRTSHKMLGGAA